MIDTHTHLDDHKYIGQTQDIIDNLANNGIQYVINSSCDYKSMMASVRLAAANCSVYCTVGMHPHDAKDYDDNFEQTLLRLADNDKVVAVGEIGLDYYYELTDRTIQRDVFARQLELADQLRLPVVLHIRDAYQDAEDILRAQRRYLNSGVLWHCYSGSGEFARQFVKQGHFFAFGGAVTFANSNKQSVTCCIPIQQVLSETDCPYMTPVPHRGKLNYPHYVRYVVDKLAQLYNCASQDLDNQIMTNSKKLFGRIK